MAVAATVRGVVAILVTGMSGTGTSTALAEPARRGFRVVDTDSGGYGVEVWSAQEIKPQARVLATDRGIDCVTVDYAVLKGTDDPTQRLF